MADDKGPSPLKLRRASSPHKKGVAYESVSPQSEEGIISFWKENKIFERSLQNRENPSSARAAQGKEFVFYEGPPYANGLPGIHHVEARAFKDIMLRYKTMRGFFVPRQAGWDTHGLPVEIAAEKALGISSKKEIEEKIGVEKFVGAAKKNVFFYKDAWEKMTERMAYWLDLPNAYVTMANNYIESLWWIFSEISKRGLLYQGYRVVPWCARCGTPLSSHELAQGYANITEDSVYVKFRLTQAKQKKGAASFLVWTTTPWTLPANVALAVNPKLDYVTIKPDGNPDQWLILAESRLGTIAEKYKIIDRVKGSELAGIEYEPLWADEKAKSAKAYRVVAADFVSAEDGSGIVHIAPAFGVEDLEVGKAHNFPTLVTVDDEGKMLAPNAGWNGKFIKDADPLIIRDLESRGFLYKMEKYAHDYPFCWRCGTPLFYYAKTSWFFKTTAVKDKMIAENKTIDWRPEYIKGGRFGSWLEENVDWAISRERYWGTPLPIWKCGECGEIKVAASLVELDALDPAPTTLILMRHGEAEHNVKGLVNPVSPEDDAKNLLTAKGEREVKRTADILKKTKIDVIISSPSHRAKETARIVGEALDIVSEIETMPELYDTMISGFDGKTEKEFKSSFASPAERFYKKPNGSENLRELRARVMKAAAKICEKYRGKTVLVLTHGDPAWLLLAALEGRGEAEYESVPYLKPAEFIRARSHNWPYNHEGELDLHKPFVDSIILSCPACKGSMKRTPEVADVWFDSGSMPYASLHYPMENRELFKKRYPADYICEAIDQTRGWFYTLLAVSSLLGYRSAYKRVVSLGLVLDEKGEKMSKSRGNVVDPNALFEKYGVDAVRWYFFTVNQPWDDKLFREEDIQGALRGFLLILWNSFVYWKTYARNMNREARSTKRSSASSFKFQVSSPKLVINKWILAKWQDVLGKVTEHLENYRMVEAARKLGEFVVNDLSHWYIRRIRSEMKRERSLSAKECGATLGFILAELAKTLAPFTPFIAEGIYQGLGAKKPSVHMEDWPFDPARRGAQDKPKTRKLNVESRKLLENMEKVRAVVAEALEARQKAGIKIRQPLSRLLVNVKHSMFDRQLANLICGEVNVKKVEFKNDLKTTVELDTVLTPELKEEGFVREFIRQVQDFRKELGLSPQKKVILVAEGSPAEEKILKRYGALVKKEVAITKFGIRLARHSLDGDGAENLNAKKEVTINGEKIGIGIR